MAPFTAHRDEKAPMAPFPPRDRVPKSRSPGLSGVPKLTSPRRPEARLAGPLRDVDRRADVDLVVELDDVGNQHADAAVGGGAADRARRVGSVDAGAVEDAHPARLERVLGHAARDHLTRDVAGP